MKSKLKLDIWVGMISEFITYIKNLFSSDSKKLF